MTYTPSDAFDPLALPQDVVEALTVTGAGLEPLGGPLSYFATVESTNDVAARLAAAGRPAGTTVFADAQTAGRGRLGRAWFSPPGAGLYVSCIWRPPAKTSSRAEQLAGRLTLAAGVALAGAVKAATGLEVEIKWPNDLVVKHRKLAGILAEGSATAGLVDWVILGFGVNLRSAAYPQELADSATSIETELGRPVDRGLVLAHALQHLGRGWADLEGGRFDDILGRWRAMSPSSRGRRVQWAAATGIAEGITSGVSDEGELVVVRTNGATHRILSGEIRWL